jgi:hypothetical protein
MNRSKFRFAVARFPLFLPPRLLLLSSKQSTASSAVPPLTVRSNLVLVPALVKTKASEVIFSLDTDDFTFTDDGVP